MKIARVIFMNIILVAAAGAGISVHGAGQGAQAPGQSAAAAPAAQFAMAPDSHAPADIIFTHGNIYTGDAKKPRATALAIRGEWIIAVGSASEMKKFSGAGTRIINLHGQFVIPGFNDAHVHVGEAGRAKLAVNLMGAKSLGEFQQRIRDSLPSHKPGAWITGFGWDHTMWPDRKFPTRQDLDGVATDRPMIFERVDGHVAVANSAALAAGGITRATPNPPGGKILRDPATGEPTGMLEEDAAMDLVRKRVPPPSPEERRRELELALADALQNGVTSIQDFSAWDDFLVYQQLQREGKLPVRITEWLPFQLPIAKLKQMRAEGGTTDPWLKTGMLKAFLDGSLGSRTAALLAPYSDDPANRGILLVDYVDLTKMAVDRDSEGFQLGFHAIGDRANKVALDTYAAIIRVNGQRDRRDRIEHAQVVAPSDFPRFAQEHIIASMQPSHETTDMRWAESRIGPERAKGAYAWNTLESEGVMLAFGTDYPVEPINPMRGLYACTTRELPEGGPPGGWQPREKLPIEDCIRAYTYGSSYAQFEETRKGILAAGQLADMVALSSDLTRIPPKSLLKTQVQWTLVGGKFQFQQPK